MTTKADIRRARVEELLATASTLTALQRRFVIAYLTQDGPRPSATQAYRDAGGTARHADRAAYRLRWHPAIVAAIDEYFHAQEMGAREVVARLSQQARAEYSHYLRHKLDSAGRPLLWVDLDAMIGDGNAHLIKGYKYDRDGRLVVEFHDAQQALVHVGRFHGLFKDVSTVTLDVSNLSDEELDELADSL